MGSRVSQEAPIWWLFASCKGDPRGVRDQLLVGKGRFRIEGSYIDHAMKHFWRPCGLGKLLENHAIWSAIATEFQLPALHDLDLCREDYFDNWSYLDRDLPSLEFHSKTLGWLIYVQARCQTLGNDLSAAARLLRRVRWPNWGRSEPYCHFASVF